MDGWLIALIVAGGIVGLVLLLQTLGLVDLRDKRRRGGSSGAFTAIDEVFFPTRAEALQERSREATLPAPAPIPGDGDLGVYEGRVRIDVDADRAPRSH